MSAYFRLLLRGVNALPLSTPETRQQIYQRARDALIGALTKVAPPLDDADIEAQRQAFEEAVERVEAQAANPLTLRRSVGSEKHPGGSGSWLTELLARASEDDTPPSPPAAPPRGHSELAQSMPAPKRETSVAPFLRRPSRRTADG